MTLAVTGELIPPIDDENENEPLIDSENYALNQVSVY